MNDEQKLGEIKRRVEAVVSATRPRDDEEQFGKFREASRRGF